MKIAVFSRPDNDSNPSQWNPLEYDEGIKPQDSGVRYSSPEDERIANELKDKSDEELDKEYKSALNIVAKPERIEKLRDSSAVEINENDYAGKFSDRKSAKQWMRDNLRGDYVNEDTNDRISITNVGINEVTSHGTTDDAHMKSLVAIPEMIKKINLH